MANMTSQTGSTPQDKQDAQNEQNDPSIMARASAGASALTNQQLRKARDRFGEQITSQRERVTGRARTLSRALRGAGEVLEKDDLVAQCLHYAGDKVESVAGYVEELSPENAAEDLREVARDRPALFFGGAFVLGLALGRFARSTAGSLSAGVSGQGGRPRRAERGNSIGSEGSQGRANPGTQVRASGDGPARGATGGTTAGQKQTGARP
jgi:hypothetical protein